jgi:tRNA dimethylallyltransferase
MRATGARPDAILLMGPTASGKTALSLELARRFPVALVSVDSAQVYRGMDVGTAKPDVATRAAFPHALVDIRDPHEPYSAAEFRADALAAMDAARAAGRVPLLVGGTGLYFRALERGLSALPEADPVVRARIEAEAAAVGWAGLHARLAARDPAAAARIHPNDPQRIGRALEVIELTGQPLSGQQHGGSGRPPWRLLKLALWPDDRAELHRRIALRFDAMLAAGLVDEVARLRADPRLRADSGSMRAVGYRQAWAWLDAGGPPAALRASGIHATRQLAKRQLTWLRSECDAFRLRSDGGDAARRVAAFLGSS